MMIVISIEFALLYYSRCLVGYVYYVETNLREV